MATFQSKEVFWNKTRTVFEYYLSASTPVNETLDEDKDLYLREVRLHLNNPATQEEFSISLDSGKGAEYDVKLFNYDMSEDLDGNVGVVTDVVWRPSSSVRIDNLDTVVFKWNNTDALTWGLTVIVEE